MQPKAAETTPSGHADADRLTKAYQTCRAELTVYLTRLVLRPAIAQELVQTTMVRALESAHSAPDRDQEIRPWLFRIATNLAIDERRRHRTWREITPIELRAAANGDPSFMAEFNTLAGSPEMLLVAKEHLAICFSCVLGQLPNNHAATLLLKEAYGFDAPAIGDILDASPTQVKNWLQKARARMRNRYSTTCSLVTKQGVCYQCVQLADILEAKAGNPLAGAKDPFEARLAILRELRGHASSRWGDMLGRVLQELLGPSTK